DAPLLGNVPDDLHELLASLLGQLGNPQPDQISVVGWRHPDVGLEDRPLDRLDRRPVVRLDRQQPGLRSADRRELLERRLRAVVVDRDAVEQHGARPPGAHRPELVADRLDGLAHPLPGVLQEIVNDAHGLTRVPTRWPDTILSMLRPSAMLKTTIGRLLSM